MFNLYDYELPVKDTVWIIGLTPEAAAGLVNLIESFRGERNAAIARAEAAEKRVQELESQLAAQAWRPVTEPPDKKGSYLLAYDDRNAYCLGWWHGKDSIYGWGRYGDHATHWQPLPAPPQDTPASGR